MFLSSLKLSASSYTVDLPQADLGTDLLAAAACEDAGQAKALLQLMDERLAIRRTVRIVFAMMRVHALRILLAAAPLAAGNPLDPADLMTAKVWLDKHIYNGTLGSSKSPHGYRMFRMQGSGGSTEGRGLGLRSSEQ
ncbi:hypothetical protein AK812_SmicGene18599 [Symbiodinium microadriaticum]|uniref:Uncharacterized protein n=1 Tax=Symbiodinium microadriaticum TaxID=2951 RepID=A0A1Q9DUT5_SYMMI|nr:hypothetical protein AK812_SmicGene18599 [Symbiodinium microadriaticum]